MWQPGTRASAWGALAGFVGGLCYIGPSAAVLLGLGSSSALAGLTLDHTLALTGGGALLLAGVILALRRSRACDIRSIARWRQPALMLATFALAYGLLGLFLPVLAEREADVTAVAVARAPLATSSLRRVTLLIDKMNCPPCAAKIRGALKRNPAVRSFVAETNGEVVTIDYDSHQTTAQALARRFPGHYSATLLSDAAAP